MRFLIVFFRKIIRLNDYITHIIILPFIDLFGAKCYNFRIKTEAYKHETAHL